MEQRDRERSLIKFRNGTCQILVATDLAARGIDIPEMKYIMHYELPKTLEEFTHRNGRTARVNAKGTAYVLKWEKEYLPEFIKNSKATDISVKAPIKPQYWETLFISGGRKDKISKGDIAGLFFKIGNLNKDQLGAIELKQDCAFVAVPHSIAGSLVEKLNNETDDERFNDMTFILFDQALLSEGGQLDDPATFVKRLNELLLSLSK